MSPLKQLFAYAGRFKYLTMASWFLSAASAWAALVPFVYIWMILRDVLTVAPHFERATQTAHYGWMAVAFSLLSIGLYLLGLLCSHLAAFRIAANIRSRLMHHIITLPQGFVGNEGSGSLRKIVNESSEATETYLAHQLPDKAGSMATPIGLLVLLLVFDWRLGLLSLLPMLLGFAIMYSFMTGKELQTKMAEYQTALDSMSNQAVEYVRGIPVVKTFGQTVFSFKKFKQAIDDYQRWVIDYTRQMRLPMVCYTTVINSVFAVLVAAALYMAQERVTQTFLLHLIYYVIITPIITVMLTRIMYQSQNNLIVAEALKRINGVLTLQPLSEPRESCLPEDNSIVLEEVVFRYKGAAKNALDGISLHVKAGEQVALVGPSGGGKTTLGHLITRFWDVDSGVVRIGNVDVRHLRKEDLMRQVSFVFQDSRLLKGSILDNVRLGRPKATEQEVREALHKAQCDDIIDKLPDGLHTVIGTQGTYLSGGEQQRIAIARVMLQDTPIVILDEATAFADPDNEARVQAAFAEMARGKTVITIAHRLSAVTKAHRIYVLKGGKIVEEGTHHSLIARKEGLYARLWAEYNQSVHWNVGGEK
jgi:ABC superfamily ATP binding cassette transporter, ABC/membrane protein